MTNISKQALNTKQEQVLFKQISSLFADKSASEIHKLLSDLLGLEEKIMLAKRLAIIILLDRQKTSYFIASTLHVSSATVTRIDALYKNGEYVHIASLFRKKTISINTILENLDTILHLGGILPHYGQTHRSEAFKKQKR